MNTTFEDLGLSEATLSAVKRLGFTAPTPVQEQAIPLALAGRDVVAAAKTGTGKTAAFSLPTIERIGRSKRPGAPKALIVSPTRELAMQIDQACFAFARNSKHRVLTVVGGISYNTQINKLKRGVDILVATPGRLYDLMERKVVHLDEVEVLVLDEADRMLDMGFWPTMKKIVAATPNTRQTLLFSATIDRKIMKNIEPILKDPAFVEVAHCGETADTVDHFVMSVAHREKQNLLRALLHDKGADRSIVFTRTKSRSDSCTRQLRAAGFSVDSIHSNKSQSQRKRALDDFSKGKTNILVATDVLARGIDVSQVEQVINYDLPDCPEDYIHRIGRTGRAGEAGYAISFVSPETKGLLKDIERLLGEKIPTLPIEGYRNTVQIGDSDTEGGAQHPRCPSTAGSEKSVNKVSHSEAEEVIRTKSVSTHRKQRGPKPDRVDLQTRNQRPNKNRSRSGAAAKSAGQKPRPGMKSSALNIGGNRSSSKQKAGSSKKNATPVSVGTRPSPGDKNRGGRKSRRGNHASKEQA